MELEGKMSWSPNQHNKNDRSRTLDKLVEFRVRLWELAQRKFREATLPDFREEGKKELEAQEANKATA
ncbi:MAG: hypothetical protein D6719_12965 [Candidatus Dadabacteria bacterium]|nr:MAG: hypothetical protein D6719_12965 [Candidatus Dadabacteria bacterium]